MGSNKKTKNSPTKEEPTEGKSPASASKKPKLTAPMKPLSSNKDLSLKNAIPNRLVCLATPEIIPLQIFLYTVPSGLPGYTYPCVNMILNREKMVSYMKIKGTWVFFYQAVPFTDDYVKNYNPKDDIEYKSVLIGRWVEPNDADTRLEGLLTLQQLFTDQSLSQFTPNAVEIIDNHETAEDFEPLDKYLVSKDIGMIIKRVIEEDAMTSDFAKKSNLAPYFFSQPTNHPMAKVLGYQW